MGKIRYSILGLATILLSYLNGYGGERVYEIYDGTGNSTGYFLTMIDNFEGTDATNFIYGSAPWSGHVLTDKYHSTILDEYQCLDARDTEIVKKGFKTLSPNESEDSEFYYARNDAKLIELYMIRRNSNHSVYVYVNGDLYIAGSVFE